jgi:GDP-L-fucose synthase
MFFNLARNKGHFGKFINLGSGAVYDGEHYLPKMKEEYFGKHIPKDEHGFSKYVINKYIESEKDYTDLRIFGIYGKYEDYEIRFISNAVCKTLFDMPVTIKQNRLFDYIWIDDLYPVLEFFIENDTGYKAYNITPDKSASLYEIAETVREISGKNNEIITAKDGMGTQYAGDNSRLKSVYAGLKLTDIRTGIENLYKYYKSNTAYIDKSKLLFDK